MGMRGISRSKFTHTRCGNDDRSAAAVAGPLGVVVRLCPMLQMLTHTLPTNSKHMRALILRVNAKPMRVPHPSIESLISFRTGFTGIALTFVVLFTIRFRLFVAEHAEQPGRWRFCPGGVDEAAMVGAR